MREYVKEFIKSRKKAAAAVLLIAAVVFAVLCFGNGGETGGGETAETVSEPASSQTEENREAALYVSAEEEELLSGLYRELKRGELGRTAEIMNENEEQLKALLQDTLGGGKYCYYEETDPETGEEHHKMKELTEEGEETGMVITRYNTVFFGNFCGGRPEGTCLAVQAMVLNEPRYTYADGLWSKGKMNGEGKTGYRYYENVPEGAFGMTEKNGTYKENLLDGSFSYRAEYGSGEKLHWEMEADRGVTVLSEAWVYYEDREEYMLPSREDASRAYVLKEDQAGAVLWNNLILWDE